MEQLTYFSAPGVMVEPTADEFASHLKRVLCAYNNARYSFKFTPLDMEERSRKTELVLLRQAFCFVYSKTSFFTTLRAIGSYLGSRDHTTVIYSTQTFVDLLDCEHAAATDLYNYLKNRGLLLYDHNIKRKTDKQRHGLQLGNTSATAIRDPENSTR